MENFLELSNLEQFYNSHPNSVVFAALASRYVELGMLDKALATAEQGTSKLPTYGYGFFLLGVCQYQLQDFPNAKESLEKSTVFDPHNPRAWRLLGEINEKLNQSEAADLANTHYFLLDPFNPDAAEKYQRADMIHFDAFEQEDATLPLPMPSMDEYALSDLEDTVTERSEPAAEPEETITDRPVAEPDPEATLADLGETVTNLEVPVAEEPSVADEIDFTFTDEVRREDDAPADVSSANTLSDDFTPEAESLSEEGSLDSLFEGGNTQEEEGEISRKVEEVFKETLGDMSIDVDTEKNGTVENGSVPSESQEETAGPLPEDRDDSVGDMMKDDISAALDDFFAAYESDESASTAKPSEDSFDVDSIEFSDSHSGSADSDMSVSDEAELLDFSAVVDDFAGDDADFSMESMNSDFSNTISFEEENDASDESSSKTHDASLLDEPDISIDNSMTADESIFTPQALLDKSEKEDASSKKKKGSGRPPILSPTLGEIYIAQGRFEEAIDVFQQLLAKDPGNPRFEKKIDEVRKMLARQQ